MLLHIFNYSTAGGLNLKNVIFIHFSVYLAPQAFKRELSLCLNWRCAYLYLVHILPELLRNRRKNTKVVYKGDLFLQRRDLISTIKLIRW